MVKYETDAVWVFHLFNANFFEQSRYWTAIVMAHTDIRLYRNDFIDLDFVSGSLPRTFSANVFPIFVSSFRAAIYPPLPWPSCSS